MVAKRSTWKLTLVMLCGGQVFMLDGCKVRLYVIILSLSVVGPPPIQHSYDNNLVHKGGRKITPKWSKTIHFYSKAYERKSTPLTIEMNVRMEALQS